MQWVAILLQRPFTRLIWFVLGFVEDQNFLVRFTERKKPTARRRRGRRSEDVQQFHPPARKRTRLAEENDYMGGCRDCGSLTGFNSWYKRKLG